MATFRSGLYADGDPDLAQALWAADENLEARRRTRRTVGFGVVFIVVWLAFLFATWPAVARHIGCAPTQKVIDEITGPEYSERQFGKAVAQDDGSWRLFYAKFAGEDTTWTILDIHPGGMACLVKAGKGELPRWVENDSLGRSDL